MIDKIAANVARLDQHADVINQKADKSELNSLKNTVNNKADSGHKHNSIWSESLNMYINTNGHFLPGKTTQQLGTSGVRWNYVCLAHNPDVSSDRRLKQDFDSDMSRYIKMLDAIEPTSYTLIEDDDGVRHVGFIAQDVWTAMKENSLSESDFGGFVRYEKEEGSVYGYALRYEEFIPILLAKIRELEARIEKGE